MSQAPPEQEPGESVRYEQKRENCEFSRFTLIPLGRLWEGQR